jgi:hypothetical protein
MMSPTEHNSEVKKYLLGVLPQEAQQQVEQRLLTEAGFLEELLLAEDELVDQYICDALSGEDHDRFEHHFLSTPERFQKLKFGRALSRYVSEKSEGAVTEPADDGLSGGIASTPAGLTLTERLRVFWGGQGWGMRTAYALAALALITGALWLSLPRRPTPRTFATLALTISAGNRAQGVGASRITLPLNADALSISLALPTPRSPGENYRVELVNDEGESRPLQIAGGDAQSVSVVIPAAELTRGQYALKLFTTKAGGTEQPVGGSYFFTAE